MTDLQPDLSLPDTLNGFAIPGAGTTTILPKGEILYAEHSHTHASMNEDGVEVGEGWIHREQRVRMGIDY